MSAALLIARLYFGLGLASHGTQKLFGWFGGHGLEATSGFFDQLGFRPGRLFAAAASLGEITGGLLVALGLVGPVGPALALLVMIVAAATVHFRNGFFAMNDGIELPLLYGAGALVLAFAGPGDYSLDRALGLSWLTSDRSAWIAIAVAVVVAALNIVTRHPSKQPSAQAA